jgi:diadenosine tetraphosphate (Ap4A) HIT family hydrolase
VTDHATLFACRGGALNLPSRELVLVDRRDGGHLVVVPARPVWERSELDRDELFAFSALVAAAGRAMLDSLEQLDGGCVNYWDAGNWALNEAAEPRGPKWPRRDRKLHVHLLGRSRAATRESHRWGEAPRFPDFAQRFEWAAGFERLTGDECARVAERTAALLRERYAMPDAGR